MIQLSNLWRKTYEKTFYKKWWVWIIAALLIIFVAAGISGNKKDGSDSSAENKKTALTVDEYKKRVDKALKEMGDKTKLKVIPNDVTEDGKTVVYLSQDIMIFLETNKEKHVEKASLAMNPNAYLTTPEDFKTAFTLLIGTVDDSLSFGERNLVKQELGISDEKVFSKDHTKAYKKNGIMYTYKGSIKDNFILQVGL